MPARYAQPILLLVPCGDYHEKKHPHYAELLAREPKSRRFSLKP
jgi:hypothetical protein